MIAGGNAPVPTGTLGIRVLSGKNVDISSFRLYSNMKVKDDNDMVFYGQKANNDGTITMTGNERNSLFSVNLPRLSNDVQKIAFSATCDAWDKLSSAGNLSIQVELNNEVLLIGNVDLSARTEAALILGELYRRNNEWKFRFVSQGFNGGLKPLAEHFGVEIAESDMDTDLTPDVVPSPAPRPTPAPAPTIKLSKISLTKESPKISLTKRNDFGLVKINLNWNQKKERGFFNSLKGNPKIDLDLGCFVRLKNGDKFVVQALGNGFGNLNTKPFVKLQDDDRSGNSLDGEWLHINGSMWSQIDEVLIYAFIYDGAANWDKTDGVVTINIPNETPVETKLTQGNSNMRMCAIARVINRDGAMSLERLNQYIDGHSQLDKMYQWGFVWRAGSKD